MGSDQQRHLVALAAVVVALVPRDQMPQPGLVALVALV
jgi:hypothetical protein